MRGLLFAVILLSLSSAPAAAELQVTETERTLLAVTIYGQDQGLVEDRRAVRLEGGKALVAFEGVSPRLGPTSAWLDGGDGVAVRSLTYDTNVLNTEMLLRHSIGQVVDVIRTHPVSGEDTIEAATVLAVEGGVMLRYRDRIESGSAIPGRLAFRQLPAGWRARPTLVAALTAETAGERNVTLRYLTDGLSWSADYVAEVDEAAERLLLSAKAIIVNESGLTFPEARVGLIAGDVVHRRERGQPEPAVTARAPLADAAVNGLPQREAVADLHLYTLPGAVTLADRQTTQVPLIPTASVPFQRILVSEHGVAAHPSRDGEPQPSHPLVRYSFLNIAPTLGQPLPAGTVRLFGRDESGIPRLLGEDRLPATPSGQLIALTPFRAFDVTVLRRQTDFAQIGSREAGVVEAAYQIDVRNAKTTAVTLKLIETMPADWTMLAASAPHDMETAARVSWTLDVAPQGSAQLTFRVRLRR